MALSIGVRKGSKIKVGECMLEVLALPETNQITVSFDGKQHTLTDEERILLAPDVYASVGKTDASLGVHYSRIAFEAPRRIRIERQN